MKRFKLLSLAMMAASQLIGAPRQSAVPADIRIDPPCWWTGMANDTLQLMISAPDIARSTVSIDYPGVTVLSKAELTSPNYQIVYLKLDTSVKAGEMPIVFSRDGKKRTVKYPLLPRDRKPEEYRGFSAADVLYLLMPDRFAQGSDPEAPEKYAGLKNPVHPDRTNPNGRHGGDLRGIRDRLDYIDSLGVTAIWVCPVLENDMPGGSYHGYATTDYYRIDPRFGSNEEWNALISDAHKKGLKVVMDMIFNHSGSAHPWLKDMPSEDWYNHPAGDNLTNFRLSTLHDPYVSDYDLDHTVNGWFVPDMPDLNQRNPHLMKYLTQNSIWWIESSKIDGIRMDTYPYADMKAMAQWAKDVLTEYPGFNIVGECWYGNEAGGAFWQAGSKTNPVETNLPTVMDFKLSIDKEKMFNEETDPWNGLNHVYDHLALDYLYPDPQHILTFLDNHDTDRFLAKLPEDLGSWKQAMAFLLTSRGIPQLYYGTELLMNGSKKITDGDIRLDMPGGFPGDTVDSFTQDGRTALQNEAWDFLSRILNWRRGEANDVIARGSLKHFMPQNGIYAYERRLGDRQVVVLLNGTDKPLETTMERTAEILPYGTVLTDIVTGKPITITETMTFSPRQVLILQNF